MPLYDKKKYSKSEIILRLADPNTRNSMIAKIESSSSLFPLPYLYKPLTMKKQKKTKPIELQTLSDEDKVKKLAVLPKSSVMRVLRSKKTPFFISKDISFDSNALQIFYLSILIFQERESQNSFDVLNVLEKQLIDLVFNEYKNTKVLEKKCFINFSKEAVLYLMNTYEWRFIEIVDFLVLLNSKMQPSVIEIWFMKNFDMVDECFRRLNSMVLGNTVVFKNSVFSHLLKYKQFKKAVFNGILSTNFIMEMKDYAYRPDYDYFYTQNKIKRKNSSFPLPKDIIEFGFFTQSKKLNKNHLIQIRNYLTKIGYSSILYSWINQNLDVLIKLALSQDSGYLALPILTDTIKYNSNLIKINSDSKAIESNKKLFSRLQNNEDYFRKSVHLFYNESKQIICRLIAKDETLELSDVFNQINQGYETELIEYFNKKPLSAYLSHIDTWSLSFFLKYFSSRCLTEEESILLLDFIDPYKNEKNYFDLICGVYDKICDKNLANLFKKLPEPLKFIFSLKHKDYASSFITTINPTECNLIQASMIYEVLCTSRDIPPLASLYYKIATDDEIWFDEESCVSSLFVNNFILKGDSYYLIVIYFDLFVSQVVNGLTKEDFTEFVENPINFQQFFTVGCGKDRIKCILQKHSNLDLKQQASFVMQFNLSDKYSLFILFDKLHKLLISGTSIEKIFVLNFIDPALLSKHHILIFIDCIIPLLNSSNRILCNLSKIKFKQIKVDTQEIQNVLPEIIQCFYEKNNFIMFYNVFQDIFFNNYLCFNSLNIIVQLLFKNLENNTRECLNVLSRIINITKDKDIKHISGLVFSNIAKFVVNNNFYTTEALDVAAQFCLYAKFEDFDILIKNNGSLRICNYLIGILKVKGDAELNNQIIQHVLQSSKFNHTLVEDAKDCSNTENAHMKDDSHANGLRVKDNALSIGDIEPSFIAAACELPEFTKYLQNFVPVIKNLFKSPKAESRQISCKAIKSIFENDSLEEYKKDLNDYLVSLCISMDHNIRLSALDVLQYLPIIYILRNDNHTLVKKKAYELWKQRVSNTNKALKGIYKEVLGFLEYNKVATFAMALKSTVSEMAAKYQGFLELYLEDTAVPTLHKEFVFTEASRISKLVPAAILFCKSNYCPSLFKVLFKNVAIRDKLVENSDRDMLIEICAEDCDLALFLFLRFGDPVYIEFLSTPQKTDLIKNHHVECKVVTLNDENIIFILQSVAGSREMESLLIRIHPSFSYFYLSVNRVNYGILERLYERVFDVCHNLDELINDRSIEYIKGCSYERVKDKQILLFLLIKMDDRRSFERAVEIIKICGYDMDMAQPSLFLLLGYFFRNYLSKNRKTDAEDCILIIHKHFLGQTGFFETITNEAILNK